MADRSFPLAPVEPHLVIIENYGPDRLRSMAIYADLLARAGAAQRWRVTRWHPPVVWGGRGDAHRGLGKWLGYADKYLLAPWGLWRVVQRQPNAIYHLADQGHAPWLRVLPAARTAVTVHDVIAIRRARGEFPDHPVGRYARWQQGDIVAGLKRARTVVCDSKLTRNDLARVVNRSAVNVAPVAHLPVGQRLAPLDEAGVETELTALGLPAGKPFLLHHGGNAFYKNRALVWDLFAALAADFPQLQLVFSGAAAAPEIQARVEAEGLVDRVHHCTNVSPVALSALYRGALTLVFPSWVEGYGWPPLEAASVGGMVVASPVGVLPEVFGDVGLPWVPPDDLPGWITCCRQLLLDPEVRRRWRTQIAQTPLPTEARFVAQMGDIWRQLLPRG